MMKTQKQIRAEKVSYWQPHIERCLLSGAKTKAYCDEHGLNHGQFKYWQYQLAPQSKKQSKSKLFSELKALDDEVQFKAVKLEIGNNYTVTLSGEFDNQMILRVLNALEGGK